ncbi:TPA: hypothetical protein ACH3X2_005654 [Trebouxia sp. C0005]
MHCQGRADSPARLPCPSVITCQRDSIACSMPQQYKHCKKCTVYLLTQLSAHLSCIAMAGQTTTALLSTHARVTTWYHCICMQQVATLQAVEMCGVFTDKTKHKLIAHCKDRADSNSLVRLPCPAVLTCQRHYEPSAIKCSTQQHCILKTCKTKQVCCPLAAVAQNVQHQHWDLAVLCQQKAY